MKSKSFMVRFGFVAAIAFALVLAVVPVALAEEGSDLSEAQTKAVSWYLENNNPPVSWVGMSGLWGAGEDLSASPWETTQEWRDEDYEHDTGTHWHVKYIFKLLSAGMDPSDAWGGTNIFKELVDLQKKNGEFEGYSDAAHCWPLVALDIGKELGLDVGSWNEDSQEKAVEYLLTKQNADGSFTGSGIDTTGDYLVALSNYTDEQDVGDSVSNAIVYLKNVQDDQAFFPGWGERNANSQSKAISGLVAVGEDLLDQEGDWVKGGNTPLDALLEFQQEDGNFHWQLNNPGVGTFAQDDALVALSCLLNENSTWHRMGETETVTVDLRATGIAGDIFDEENLEIPAGEVTVVDFTLDQHTAMGALAYYCQENDINIEITEGDWGRYVCQIGDDSDDENSWMYYVDESSPWVGADQYDLSEGESVHFVNFNLSLYSLSMSIEPESIAPGDTVMATVLYTDGDGEEVPAEEGEIYYTDELDDFGSPVAGTLLKGVNTDVEGKASFTWEDEGTFYFYAQWQGKSSQYQWPVATLTVTAEVDNNWVEDQVANVEADALAYNPNDELTGAFSGHGVWHYDGMTWEQVVGNDAVALAYDSDDNLAGAFPGFGVYVDDGTGWAKVADNDATALAYNADGKLTANFPGWGIYHYDGNDWDQLEGTEADALAYNAAGNLVGSFPGVGVYELVDGKWVELNDVAASALAAGTDLAGAFPGFGVFVYDVDWVELANVAATSLAYNSTGDLAGAFGSFGIWYYIEVD